MKLSRFGAAAVVAVLLSVVGVFGVQSQAFAFTSHTYELWNKNSSYCLDSGAGKWGTTVTAQPCNYSTRQQWVTLNVASNGLVYSLRSKASGLCIGIPVGNGEGSKPMLLDCFGTPPVAWTGLIGGGALGWSCLGNHQYDGFLRGDNTVVTILHNACTPGAMNARDAWVWRYLA